LVKTDDGFMAVDPVDAHVSRQLLRTGQYNPSEVNDLKSLIRPSDRVLIVGGHIGAITVPLARACNSVDVIEANPKNAALLNLNLKLNSIQNVKVHEWAACEKAGQIQFLTNTENSGGSKRHPIQRLSTYLFDKPEIILVKTNSIDKIFRYNFDVILMDIEGSEYFAIKGAINQISEARVFIFEFRPHHLRDIAGVSLDDFMNVIPLSSFNRAILPRQNLDVDISVLKSTLDVIIQKNEYEDGVILKK
jgi:FkbM family methyltransferase